MILFVDTETTGVPKNYKAPVTDLENWPRLVQLGYIVYDVLDGGEVNEYTSAEFIVRPDGFVISPEVSKIHGVTQEKALTDGDSLHDVLTMFFQWASVCDTLVGHNLNFDMSILGAEFIRADIPNILIGKAQYDTMLKSVDFCKMPGGYGGKYKWPKLKELYHVLFNEDLAQTHTALDDIRQTAKCYFELQRRGIR